MRAGRPGMTAPISVGSFGRNALPSSLRQSIITGVGAASLAGLVASIVGPRYGRPALG